LEALEAKGRRKNNANIHDALLGEVAIKNEMVLVTNDGKLAEVVKAKGGYVRTVPYQNSKWERSLEPASEILE
jgi:predicted nucleic acid-binding protein